MKQIRCECGQLHAITPSLIKARTSRHEPLVIECACGHAITIPLAVLNGAFYGELTEDFISQF